MNPGLLNIWRENGANLRFGETKNLIAFGVTTALFAEFLNRAQNGNLPRWSYAAFADAMGRDIQHALVMIALGLSIAISILSVFPNLSGRYWRLKGTLRFCRALGLLRAPDGAKTSYFMDVAAFPSPADYAKALLEAGASQTEWTIAERDMITQIWIVSRIAAMKFAMFAASMILTLIAAAAIFVKGAG